MIPGNLIIKHLKDIKAYCEEHECDNCLIYEDCVCYFEQSPRKWDFKYKELKEQEKEILDNANQRAQQIAGGAVDVQSPEDAMKLLMRYCRLQESCPKCIFANREDNSCDINVPDSWIEKEF